MKNGDPRAVKVYEALGVEFGYTLAHMAEFYDYTSLLIMGRVTSGPGGEVMINKVRLLLLAACCSLLAACCLLLAASCVLLAAYNTVPCPQASQVLADEFPELGIEVIQPSEQDKRHGQVSYIARHVSQGSLPVFCAECCGRVATCYLPLVTLKGSTRQLANLQQLTRPQAIAAGSLPALR